MPNEEALAAKIRQELYLKKLELQSVVRDQHAMTALPPLRGGHRNGMTRSVTAAPYKSQ